MRSVSFLVKCVKHQLVYQSSALAAALTTCNYVERSLIGRALTERYVDGSRDRADTLEILTSNLSLM